MQIRKVLTATILVILALGPVVDADDQARGRQKSPQRRHGTVENAATFARQISFSGFDWLVKDGFSGPGPNRFSDSTRNVWVDNQGRLHLRIERRRGKWYTAEVVLADELGYGTYRFELESPVDDLDPNAVLGLFTWCDGPDEHNCEVDVEFSRWGDASNPWNAAYVVQPYDEPGHLTEFYFPEAVPSTHSFTWQPASASTFGSVLFQSWTDAYDPASAPYLSWTYAGDVPSSVGAHARINLWLRGGERPLGKKTKSIEVIVSSFAFEPLP